MELFDTHAHFEGTPDETRAAVERARDAGVTRIMSVGGSESLNKGTEGFRYRAIGWDRDQAGRDLPKLDRGDPRVQQSLDYCRKNWTVDENPGMGNQGLYYFYDIMARALSAAKVDDVGGHDWKAELSARLVSLQKEDGSWYNANNRFWEADPVLCTSFAMLVLELCR